jgi:uncharacterized protein YukE
MVTGTSSDTGVPSTLVTGADFDNFLTEVAGQPNADTTSIGHAMDHWQELGTCLVSMMQGNDGLESAAGSSAQWGPSVADLLKKHLQTWQGGAADEFTKQVNIIAQFGNAVGRAMYDQTGENTNGYYPESNTFHRALTDIQSSLQFTQQQHQWVNTTFDKWADVIANNIWKYDTRWFGNTTPSDSLPQDWAATYVSVSNDSFQAGQASSGSTTSGWLKFVIQVSGAPSGNYVIWVPAVQDGDAANSWSILTLSNDYYIDQSATSVSQIKNQIKQAGDDLYAQRLKAVAEGIVGDSGDYPQIQQQLPTKVDESKLPKGHSGGGGGGGGGSFGGGSFGGLGGGNGAGFGGGGPGNGFGSLPGGGGPGNGFGSLPGGGGGPGNGFGGLPGGGGAPGGGLGGLPGGGLAPGGGSTPTHLAGLGGGLPGGFGGGGGGFGGGGGLPGGLASAGGPGGLGSGGAAGAAANEAALAAHGEVPLMPPMMPPMMNQNQDNNRQRKSWLPEDEDLWGGAVDAVPPVISSDG